MCVEPLLHVSRFRWKCDGVLLAGSRTHGVHDAIDRLRVSAENRYGTECGALALTWLLRQYEVSAIVIGPARKSLPLVLAARAIDVVLSDQDVAEIGSFEF